MSRTRYSSSVASVAMVIALSPPSDSGDASSALMSNEEEAGGGEVEVNSAAERGRGGMEWSVVSRKWRGSQRRGFESFEDSRFVERQSYERALCDLGKMEGEI